MNLKRNNLIQVIDLYKNLPGNQNEFYLFNEELMQTHDIKQFMPVQINKDTIKLINFDEQIKPGVFIFKLINSGIEVIEIDTNNTPITFKHIDSLIGVEENLNINYIHELQNKYKELTAKELKLNI